MKKLIVLVTLLSCLSSFAESLENTRQDTVKAARVVKLISLVDKPNIKVNVVVQDLGGSTDLSPTQKILFTLYSKGEMFSTDATYDLGYVFELKSATRTAPGVYKIKAIAQDSATGNMKEETLILDASDAIVKIKAVKCEDFDCEASEKFVASINIGRK